MRWQNILIVYAKELRDMLRDRRTLMSMIIVPTLLMPGLMMTTVVLATKLAQKARSTAPAVMIVGGDDSPQLRHAIVTSDKVKVVPTTADWRQKIIDKGVQAAIEIPSGFDASLSTNELAEIRIYDYTGELRSANGVSQLREILNRYRDEFVAARLKERSLPKTLIEPFRVAAENVAPPARVGGNLFGGIVPYFFLLLSFTGAMYPALDLTAGEKERGTMETILCSPVARLDLVLGKFLMVLTASLATVLCSVASTLVTMMVIGSATGIHGAMASGANAPAAVVLGVDPLGLVGVVFMVAPMAVLFAAVQFSLALFAKSFKEAQSYVSPLVIVIILPAVIGMLPGVELNGKLALVPILNVSLVSKELVSGIWHWQWIAMIFGSTCLYAAVALGFAVRMFNREDVIFRA
jgi:sodium transport system permease protein